MAAGSIEDRWLTKRKDPKTGKRARTARWGTGKRYRVKNIPGVRDRSFDTLEDAKTWLKKASTDAERGEFYDPRDGAITLREYVEGTWWPTLRATPATRDAMRRRIFGHILPHMGGYPLNRIGPDEIKWWLTQAEQDIDVTTLRTVYRHFSKIMESARAARRIPANPFRDSEVKPPARPQSKAMAWPEASVAAVRAALVPRYRVLVDLAVGAGLRQGEAFGFSPDDMDGEVLHITRQVVKIGGKIGFGPPKGGKERDAPCPPELAEAIKAHMEAYPPVEVTLPWIDPARPNLAWEDRPTRTVRLLVTTARHAGRGGGALNRGTFDDKNWKPALAAAGVIPPPQVEVVERPGRRPLRRVGWRMPREWGFHGLRHTFASVVLQAGETPATLAEWLGHSDPAFTMRTYVHFMPEAGSQGIRALGRWVSAAAESPAARGGAEIPQPVPSPRSGEDEAPVPAGQTD